MGHKAIRTKWPQFIEAVKRGDVMVDMGKNVYRTPSRMRFWDKKALDTYLFMGDGELNDVPRYVFAEDTKEIILSKETMDTIEILKKFERYRLPHKMCVAEYEGETSGIRLFCFCYEKTDKNVLKPDNVFLPFYVCLFALYDFSNPELAKALKFKGTLRSQQFAVIYPITAEMENTRDFDDDAGLTDSKEIGGVRYQTNPTPWLSIAKMDDIPECSFSKEDMIRTFIMRCSFATRALTAMMQTKGIHHDAITKADTAKLNKKRAGARVSLIPDHVYITLGHAYDKNGKKSAIVSPTGRKLRFHMRSAHTKMQPYGPNNSLRKEIMIEAYLVNADSGGELYNPTRIVRA